MIKIKRWLQKHFRKKMFIRKPVTFWGQVDNIRVIEFNDDTAEIQELIDGESIVLSRDKTVEILSSTIHWLQHASESKNRWNHYRELNEI